MKTIVIAPYLLQKELLKKYRQNDPFVDVKFFTKSNILSNFYYSYGDEALLYLLGKYSMDYDIAKQSLNAICKMQVSSSENDKISKLISIKEELLKENLICRNEYLTQELSNAKIDVYFYPSTDWELGKIINQFNPNYIEQDYKIPEKIHHFHSNNDELFFVFNTIAGLLESGVPGNKIAIFGLQDTDELIFNRLQNNFKFHVNNAFPKTFLSKIYINKFLSNLLDYSFDECLKMASEEHDEETYSRFIEIVNKYHFELEIHQQIELYKSLFSKEKIGKIKFDDGIEVVNEPICPKDGYLFIVNMVQGKFPRLVRDNDYFDDFDKKNSGIITSSEENVTSFDIHVNYLKQNGTIVLSYSDCSFSEKYYPSPLIGSLGIEVIDNFEFDKIYSFDEAQLQYANLLDIERNYLQTSKQLKRYQNTIKIPYRTYDYRVKNINHYAFDQVLTLSYSQISKFYECKYHYYLERVLKLSDNEPNFNITLGSLSHDIFEHIDSGKTFDELYDEAYEKFKDKFEKNSWVFLRRIKEELRKSFEYVKQFESQVKNGRFEREKDFTVTIDDNILLVGKVDKIVYSGNLEDVLIIDYKTGKERYAEKLVNAGLSLQLPTYSLFIKSDKNDCDKKISGLSIQPILIPNSEANYSRVDEKDFSKFFKHTGVFSNEIDVINNLESDYESGFKFIDGFGIKKDGSVTMKNGRDEEYFNNMADVAFTLIKNAGHEILNNNFEIDPKVADSALNICTYCPFRDICYRKDDAFVTISLKEEGEEDSENEVN